MCGICGIANISGANKKIEHQSIKRMCDTLVHRGPDDEGIFLDNNIGLGARRLSIIDLVTGHQPIFNEDMSICVVCNGEIYNFKELRKLLEENGHKFRTNSDTEVIVHMYEDDEAGFLSKINGMFAFAIWDKNKRRLLLARDRLGVKPLYYASFGGQLIFASEIKAILCAEGLDKKIDRDALDYYLALNYIPSPLTMIQGIRKLPAASRLILEGGYAKTSKYWEVGYAEESPVREEEYYKENILGLLKNAVKERLGSDVPLGFLLSGGIDSSAVVAMASSFGAPLKTFSVAFQEKSFDESGYARLIAKRFNTEHHELRISPQIAGILPKLVWHLDEPCADSSAIPVYYISELARREVKVALSGDGGDELFAGYHTYNAYKFARLYNRLPAFLKDQISRIVSRLPVSYSKVSFDYKAKRFLGGVGLEPLKAHLWWAGTFSESEKTSLYSKDIIHDSRAAEEAKIFRDYYNYNTAAKELTRLLYCDLKVYLHDDILVKADRMSMANSLEIRSPFLDFRLVEFVAKIPTQLKLRGFLKKYILKKSLAGTLPKQIISRKKEGFSVPMGLWVKTHLKEMVLDSLSKKRVKEQGLFDPDYISELLNAHMEGKKDNGYRIWGLLVFSLWHDTFIKGDGYKWA